MAKIVGGGHGWIASFTLCTVFLGVAGMLSLCHRSEDYKESEPGMFACVDVHGLTEQIRGVTSISRSAYGDVWIINPGGMHYKQNVKEVCFDHVIAYGTFPPSLDKAVTR